MYVLLALVLAFAGILVLIFYFAFNPTNKGSNPVAVEDMVVYVGKESQVSYSKFDEKADVVLSIADTSVAVINENKLITGVKEGITILNVSVEYQNNKYFSVAQIKVVKDVEDNNNHEGDGDIILPDNPSFEMQKFYYDITPLTDNCIFAENKLYISDVAVFKLVLYINSAKTIIKEYSDVEFITSEGITVSRDLGGSFIVSAEKSGKVTIDFGIVMDFVINLDIIKN